MENWNRRSGRKGTQGRYSASLLWREGVPERILVKAFQECLAAYSPAQDPRYRSPYIQSPVWFQGWIEAAAETWLRARRHRQKVVDEQERRRREVGLGGEDDIASRSVNAVGDGETIRSTTLSSLHARYAGMRYLPPETVLLEEIGTIDAKLAERLRDHGVSRREIVGAVLTRIRASATVIGPPGGAPLHVE